MRYLKRASREDVLAVAASLRVVAQRRGTVDRDSGTSSHPHPGTKGLRIGQRDPLQGSFWGQERRPPEEDRAVRVRSSAKPLEGVTLTGAGGRGLGISRASGSTAPVCEGVGGSVAKLLEEISLQGEGGIG